MMLHTQAELPAQAVGAGACRHLNCDTRTMGIFTLNQVGVTDTVEVFVEA
jgi:hypothetical protein